MIRSLPRLPLIPCPRAWRTLSRAWLLSLALLAGQSVLAVHDALHWDPAKHAGGECALCQFHSSQDALPQQAATAGLTTAVHERVEGAAPIALLRVQRFHYLIRGPPRFSV